MQPGRQKEKSLQDLKGDEDLQFCWGLGKGAVRLYESFTLDGTEYFLYDCVYLWRSDQDEPDIGKLVRIWETENYEKKVEVVWFFRPNEITNWLRDIKPLQREIFLASGQGKGLSNLEPLEAISGKCSVVCSSKHERNPQPTEEEMRKADYIFYRTFDVGKYIISEMLPSSIHGIEVDHFFNKGEYTRLVVCGLPKENSQPRSGEIPVRAPRDGQSGRVEKALEAPASPTDRQANNLTKYWIHGGAKVKSEHLSGSPSDVGPMKKRKILHISDEGRRDGARPCPQSRVSGHEKRMSGEDSFGVKKEVFTRVKLEDKAIKFTEKGKQHVSPTASHKFMEVTRRPDMDSSKWLKPQPWTEERLFEAQEKGTLVILENLNPFFTSAEVEDIVWHALGQKVTAKMAQRSSFSSPRSGQAFAIFRTIEAADNAISRLTNGCLILGDGRPIVGRRSTPKKSGHSSGFVGHITIDRIRSHKQRADMRNAVSTSHFSQANTVEYQLALEWRVLQERSHAWWTELYKQQGQEIEVLRKQMKIRQQV